MKKINIYNIGDIVKLKSGGPDMTIREPIFDVSHKSDFTGNYRCQWFAGKKLDNGVFPQESLLPVNVEKIE